MPSKTSRAVVLRVLRSIYREALRELEAGNMENAQEYSKLMRRILTETRTRRPKWLSFCRYCGMLLVPGLSARIRLRRRGRMKYLVVKCLKCGYINRFPYRNASGENHGENKNKS